MPPKSPRRIPPNLKPNKKAPTVPAVHGKAGHESQSFSFNQESLTNKSIVLSPPKSNSLTNVIKNKRLLETVLVNSLKAAFSSYISNTGSQTFRGNHS